MDTSVNGVRRLMITHMVLENFKSYAGAQSVGPFHKCFSSVVGPNGSGKSNVIDAMLFVFGRKAKQLRFNKVSELIHNSTNHRNLDYAKVSVHFQEIMDQEGEGFDVVPDSQFVVARTANRNNTSDYYVNDKKYSAKDVTTMLKAKGIDLDNNRFLILQGEVEQISLMKPKAEDKNDTGLLEYLEDIIGTDVYIPQIEEENKRLEEANEKRQALIQKLKHMEKEREPLEGKKLEAEAYLGKQAERLRHQITGHRLYMHKSQAAVSDIDAKVAEAQSKLEYEKKKHEEYSTQLLALTRQQAAAEKTLDKAQQDFKAFELRDTKIQTDLKHLTQKHKKAAAKAEKEQASLQALQKDMSTAEGGVKAQQQRVEELLAELQKQEQVLESYQEAIKEEVEQHHQKLSKVREELGPWEARIAEATAQRDACASERELLGKRSKEAGERLKRAQADLGKARDAVSAKQKEEADTYAAIKAKRAELAAAEASQREWAAREAVLLGEVQALRVARNQLRSDAAAVQSSSGAVKSLMDAQASGKLKGLLGRLGDLGAIDSQYDVAVSTASGMLDYVVAQTGSDAQRAVEHLRMMNQGHVATLLILEQQQRFRAEAEQAVETPEGVPRLFDLVRCRDPSLRVAFFAALRNTVVARDLEQANRIAFGRDKRFAKVVTLKGELISESGTMSGGGRPASGKMALGNAAPRSAADAKAATAELKRVEKELEAKEKELSEAQRCARDAERAVSAAEALLSQLEVKAPTAALDAQAAAQRAADLQQRLEHLARDAQVSEEDSRRMSELQREVGVREGEVRQLQEGAAGLRKKAAALQAKIDGAGGERLSRQRKLVSDLQAQRSAAEGEATRLVVLLKNGPKQLAKMAQDLKKTEAELASLQEQISGLGSERDSLEGQALKVLQLKEATEQLVADKTQALKDARAEAERKHGEVGVIREVEVALEGKLGELKGARADEASKIRKWTDRVVAMIQEIKEYTSEAVADLTPEELSAMDPDSHFEAVVYLEEQLRGLTYDPAAVAEYTRHMAECAQRQQELAAATEERDRLRREHDALRKRRMDEFMAGFSAISLKLKEMYQMITLGGDAELELVDTLDPFSDGIVFSVRPPKKSWKNIANLSGGEKTLSSLSLVFALHHYKPTPLYVMDEIDAALDFKNVSIVGHYIKERTKNAQFVIISLRNNMFELADRLVGIYKTDNCTKTVTINPAEFVVGGTTNDKGHSEGRENEVPASQQQMLAVA